MRSRAAVLAKHPVPELPKHQLTSLEPYVALITGLAEKGLGPPAIFDRLRLEHAEFSGSHSAVKRLCRALTRARGVRPQDVAILVETAPGEIAQVDFGYVGKLFDPTTVTLRKAWCFVMVLGFSRHMVVRISFDQRTETWLALHVEAFNELGGVPATMVPDNLKAAVIRAAFSIDDQSELNRSYRESARYALLSGSIDRTARLYPTHLEAFRSVRARSCRRSPASRSHTACVDPPRETDWAAVDEVVAAWGSGSARTADRGAARDVDGGAAADIDRRAPRGAGAVAPAAAGYAAVAPCRRRSRRPARRRRPWVACGTRLSGCRTLRVHGCSARSRISRGRRR